MNVLIFFFISDILLNITNIALALYIVNEDFNGTALREESELNIFPGLMPEKVRYAKSRCSDDLPNANVNWGTQIFSNEADAHDTHCYVKCFLRRVGLIQLDTLGLDLYRLGAMLYNIQGNQSFLKNCLDALYTADEMNGKCEPYYGVWIRLFQSCHLAFNYIFYNDVQPEEVPFKKSLPLYREPGVDPFQFCSASPDLTFCMYLQLHYFDSYGRIDTTEIIHSFAGSGRFTMFNNFIIRNCAHLANAHFMTGQNSKEMTQKMSKCLMEKTPEDYTIVLQYWNEVMRVY